MRFSKVSDNPSNLLERVGSSRFALPDLTSTQSQVDQLTGGLVAQATEWKSLVAMMAGGLAYRMGRMGFLGSASQLPNPLKQMPFVLRGASTLFGLGTEVTAYELTNRSLISLSLEGEDRGEGRHSRLWTWSYPEGLKQGLLSSLITFGTLKSFGKLFEGQNLLVQHGSQDFAMVLGHQLLYRTGLGEKPEGSLASQLLHAEATNLQMAAGMALGHSLTNGKMLGAEKGLDLKIRSQENILFEGIKENWKDQARDLFFTPFWMMMGADGAAGGGRMPRRSAKSSDPLRHPKDLEAHREEKGEVWKIEGLEENRVGAKALLTQATEELREIEERVKGLEGSDATNLESWKKEIEKVRSQIGFWEGEIVESEREQHQAQARYLQDITIGVRLMLGRMSRLGALVFSQPLPGEVEPPVGLRRPRPVRILTPGVKPQDVFPGLQNFDVGFGEVLSLRFHQIEALKNIRGWLTRHQKKFESARVLSEAEQELMQGTIVMPVGGGKTRTMVASFATAIDLGLFRPEKDKFLILNHTDQIHQQNFEVVQLLGEYFVKKFGRELKATQYKADEKDLSGDVVVISVPTVSGEERRQRFSHDLARALGSEGRIAMVAVDEVHHLGEGIKKGRESWPELLKSLRAVSSNFYRLGFTATPTGHEGGVIYKQNVMELMENGVTPRTYLVKVKGIDLTDVPIRGGELGARELEETLVGEVNRKKRTLPLLKSLEKFGVAKTALSPSGKNRLEPVLGFGADLKHAQALAEDYIKYFGEEGSGLRGRRFDLLGEDRGKISAGEIEAAFKRFDQGEIDGVVAIVSGATKDRDAILEAVKQGKIEAVFSVDALVEGADLYMFTHQLGARPTFSPIKKGQERGRINRRGPDELTYDGTFKFDPPKILFDVIDEYHQHGAALLPYGAVMGLRGHTEMEVGKLYDLMKGEEVDQVDTLGRTGSQQESLKLKGPVGLPKPPRPLEPRERKPRQVNVEWGPLADKLREIFEKDYEGDLERMVWDLGDQNHFVEQLMEGKGWQDRYWFLRRLATLLHLDRDTFVNLYNEMKGYGDERVSKADHEILQEALRIYEKLEGPTLSEAVGSSGSFLWGKESLTISTDGLKDLKCQRLSEGSWLSLWRYLLLFFEKKSSETYLPDEKRNLTLIIHKRLISHFFQRQGWSEEGLNAQERLLLEARKRVAHHFGRTLPQKSGIEGIAEQNQTASLTRWLKGEKMEYSSTNSPQTFYNQVRSLLKGLGVAEGSAENMIELAIFEENDWVSDVSTAQSRLLLEVRKRVAHLFGGVFPTRPAIDGVSKQGEASPLTRWLNGEKIKYMAKSSPRFFYDRIRSILKGSGMAEDSLEEMIEAAIFEENEWPRVASTSHGSLLLEARRRTARNFGGALPSDPEIEAIPKTISRSFIIRWLKGEKIEYGTGVTSQTFFNQVRALLKGLGAEESHIEEKIEGAVFEENRWGHDDSTAQACLLLEARKRIASHFGGAMLPKDPGIQGVAVQGKNAAITRWLKGEKIKYSTHISSRSFYGQVRSLLKGLSAEENYIEEMIQSAVFEERGWSYEAPNAHLILLLASRKQVARLFGGVMPIFLDVKGIPLQAKKALLSRWVKGEKTDVDDTLAPQIRALLTHEGFMTAEEADRLIAEAQKEE